MILQSRIRHQTQTWQQIIARHSHFPFGILEPIHMIMKIKTVSNCKTIPQQVRQRHRHQSVLVVHVHVVQDAVVQSNPRAQRQRQFLLKVVQAVLVRVCCPDVSKLRVVLALLGLLEFIF